MKQFESKATMPSSENQTQEISSETRKALSTLYRAVAGRCAVDLSSMKLPISKMETLAILEKAGFEVLTVDLIVLARQCIGKSLYRRGAKPSQAPDIVDCSSFVKWLYVQRGIWLPRRSIQQREIGQGVGLDQVRIGDLVFGSGPINYYIDDPSDNVGHVGIATADSTVIHAAKQKVGVVESPLSSFADETQFRGARRYIPEDREVLTLSIPPEREVETEDDIKWIILQSLHNK
jgi:cell wall-associated NlpC family hydrolase